MALPHDAVVGLQYVVSGISWSYLLTFVYTTEVRLFDSCKPWVDVQ